jgi:quinolinate synthase
VKTVVVLAGGPDRPALVRVPADATVIAADGGAELGGPIDLLVGDLDSISAETLAGIENVERHAVAKGRKLNVWMGECHVHAGIRPVDIERWQADAPDAELLVHPECGCASQAMAFANGRTHILSTEQMINFCAALAETALPDRNLDGILHRLEKEVPDKRFEPVRDDAVCRYMKMITLENVHAALRDWQHEVTVEPELAKRAALAIERMVAIGT